MEVRASSARSRRARAPEIVARAPHAGAAGRRLPRRCMSRGGRPSTSSAVKTTVGDLRSLHAEVIVRGREVRGNARLLDGDDVKTAPGRPRARSGSTTARSSSSTAATELTLRGGRITLARGRLFVQAGARLAHRGRVRGRDRRPSSRARRRSTREAGGAPQGVLRARRARASPPAASRCTSRAARPRRSRRAAPKVAPETAFDDWTGGLAVPWSGETRVRRARSPSSGAAAATPIRARRSWCARRRSTSPIEGEVAITRTRTTYFNGSDRDVPGRRPDGAARGRDRLARRARRRGREQRDGRVAAAGHDRRAPRRRAGSSGPAAAGCAARSPNVRAGSSVDLLVDYVEWLPEKDGRATYRFPMASEVEAPMVGGSRSASARRRRRAGSRRAPAPRSCDGGIELRRADVRPTGDLVVEMIPSVVHAGRGARLRRAGRRGARIRTSSSHRGPRAHRDRASRSRSSSTRRAASARRSSRPSAPRRRRPRGARPEGRASSCSRRIRARAVVGPDKPTPVTPELRAQTSARSSRRCTRAARRTSASALERAADLLDARDSEHAGTGMVVYLGDGRPTVGETDARELRKRLARRAGGVPRLGALAIGQGADRWMLAELVAGAGPVYDVARSPRRGARELGARRRCAQPDAPRRRRSSSARRSIASIRATRAPRSPGSTVTVAGRLRGALPKQHRLPLSSRRRSSSRRSARSRSCPSPAVADVARRWAVAAHRGDACARRRHRARDRARDEGRACSRRGRAGSSAARRVGCRGTSRLLGLSPSLDTAFAPTVEPAPRAAVAPARAAAASSTATRRRIEQAAEIAAQHAIEDVGGGARSRAATRARP